MRAYDRGALDAFTKLAISDDATVATLHALGLSPVGVGADLITAPGNQWVLQPAATLGAAMGARRLASPLGDMAGRWTANLLNGGHATPEQMNAAGVIGGKLLGGLAAGGAAYGARKGGRYLTGDDLDGESWRKWRYSSRADRDAAKG